jgi:bifunctional enzyme CysN/CysC
MSDTPLSASLGHPTTHSAPWARAIVDELRYRIDVPTLDRDLAATELELNDLGRLVPYTSAQP